MARPRKELALTDEEIERLYEAGASPAEIGREAGCTGRTIRDRLAEFGVVFGPTPAHLIGGTDRQEPKPAKKARAQIKRRRRVRRARLLEAIQKRRRKALGGFGAPR